MTERWSKANLRKQVRSAMKEFSFWRRQHWPKQHRLMLTAYQIGERRGYEEAVRWAERHASGSALDGLHILRANRDKGDPAIWLDHINAYLQRYDTCKITLNNDAAERIFHLRSAPQKTVNEGPIVSVIMCVYNAQESIEPAVRSILQQSWRPLELLIVDDCSTDRTTQIVARLAEEDSRIKVHMNQVNVGPYVSRNLGLRHATGRYLTCHDSDDWAHPSRLEKQMQCLQRDDLAGCFAGMLRMRSDGQFVRPTRAEEGTSDGWLRSAPVSALFDREAFDKHLQYWDSVRFGADTELLRRAEFALGRAMKFSPIISMICLEHENSLTNHPQTGVSQKYGLSPARRAYVNAYRDWHEKMVPSDLRLAFPMYDRPFHAPDEALVPVKDVLSCISGSTLNGGQTY